MAWDLEPGDHIRRKDLAHEYGGTWRSGVAPSSKTPNVFLFSDPEVGAEHGYDDHWDGPIYCYAGRGKKGNQALKGANRSIATHREDGRALRLFWGAGGEIEYAGEFELDAEEPWRIEKGKQSGSAALRDVIMFRLRPVGAPATALDAARPSRRIVQTKRVPTMKTPYRKADESPTTKPRDPAPVDPHQLERALASHAKLQNSLEALAEALGFPTRSPGDGDPDFDLAWESEPWTVVECKSLTTANERVQLRLGLGQVLDYREVLISADRPTRPVLAVERAPTDAAHWVSVCRRSGVTLVWPGRFGELFKRRGWRANETLVAWECTKHSTPNCSSCPTPAV